ncbi:hypothetical protein D9758_006866 [Tetrapyrgos nigripes]|uniref:Uncharacterized protein n=1 Tax=Tetrapyrgos nigripes TaxID=182062 RepID=A0A8H5CVK5_9AGAR|nr:hypothetical protein D9758_006866 [Tetrapyrgos nigripes]
MWSLEIAPGDLLLEIAAHLDSRADLFNFCLSNNRIFTDVSSVLYSTVTLKSARQCINTLGMLRRRPDIARHVRQLVIQPDSKMSPKDQFLDGVVASAAVRDVAMGRQLDALSKFAWHYDELPYHDDMWFALRVCCSQLRYISTTVGSFTPTYNSHLFDFTDLRGFAVYLQRGFFENHGEMFFDEQPVSRRLWDMLMHRCTNLEELTIEGESTFPADAHHLLEGRWAKLRSLTLGDVAVDWIPGHTSAPLGGKSPFVQFLEAHPLLHSLNLSRANVSPSQLGGLSADLLHLKSFSGTFDQLQALPHIHHDLESMTFREPMQTREVTALAVAGMLQRLCNLRTLRISFTLHSMYDSANLLKSLIVSCPNLRHLELTCAHKPSFQLDSFAKSIRGLAKLRVLHLTIVKYPGDENLTTGAAKIALTNPHLEGFSLTFLPPSYPLSLPFSFSFLPFPLLTKDMGRFTLTCDNHGLPLSLRAFERRRLIWPLGLGYSYRTKRYISDLRPVGSPHRNKPGLLSLLSENSSAGEEIRMLLFCGLLVCLAFWGLLASSRVAASRHVTASMASTTR